MASRILRQIRFSRPPSGGLLSCAQNVRASQATALALAALSVVAVLSLSGNDEARSPSAPPVPGFLAEALGAEETARPLVERPRKGVTVELGETGYTVTREGASVALAREGAGDDAPWTRYEHGIVRTTAFGSETVTVDGTTTEHFLTVRERQGRTTWRWRLETRGGEPRVADDGTVELVREGGRVAPLTIRPAQILDAKGKDVTPIGAGWTIRRQAEATWLVLELDDARLPLPYVIDPATDYPSPLYLSSTASLDTNSWKLVSASPSPVSTTTIARAARNATNTYYRWNPGVENTTGTTAPAVNAAGTGWLVDTAGGTGFPAGTWNFTVETDIPGTGFTAGTAILAVGVWKAQVSGGTLSNITPITGINGITDDPAAQNLRPDLNVTTRTIGIPMPRFALAANERLYVEFWRKQVGGLNTTTVQRLQLILHVNQGTTRIAPTAVDDGAPSNVLSLTGATGAHLSGGTLYYKSNAAGSFQLRNTITDVGGTGTASGAYSSLYPAMGTAGWTHTVETVLAGPTFQSSTFSWTANPTNPPNYTVTAEDAAVNSATTNGTVSFVSDITAPTIAAPTVTAGYFTSLDVPVSLGTPTDGGSGVNAGSAIVQRDEALLDNSDGNCDAFPSSWSTVTLSGGNDTTVQSGKCYRYRHLVSDNVGNQQTSGVSATAKVDTSAPAAPSLTVTENPADPDQHVSGSSVYYRPGQAGSFKVAATASDVQSGVKHVSFPALAGLTGSGNDTTSPYEQVYSWTAGTSGAPNSSVTATNNADLTGSGSTFSVVSDSAGPTGHSVALTGGPWYTSLSVDLTPNTGSDSGAGVDATTAVIERDEAPLVNGVCDPYPSTWGTTVADPDVAVTSGKCYRYRLRVSDNVGNASAASAASASAMVDTSAPGAPGVTLAESPADPDQHVVGGTVYYRPGQSGSFAVSATASDPQSGVNHVAFPSITNVTGGANDTSSPFSETYSWAAATSGTQNPSVTATNGADLPSPGTAFTLEADSTAPASHSIGITGGPWYTSLSVDLVPAYGADGGSGVNAASAVIQRDEAPLVNGVCDPFPGTWGATVADPDVTVATGKCYRYRVTVADNVGNVSSASSPSATAMVDTSAPGAPGLTLGESPADPDQHVSGSTLFYRPGQAGAVKVSATASDAQSGIKHVAFPSVAGLTGGLTDSASPFEETYAWTGATSGSPSGSATATNNADLTGSGSSFGLTPDAAAPTTGDNTGSLGPAWRSSDAAVSLTPADGAGAGVEQTYYTTDGSVPTTSSSTGTSFTLSANGVYTIRYFSRDRVGNDESPQTGSAQIRIDKTNPASATLDALPGAIRNGQALTGSGSDTGSGVESLQYLSCAGAGCTPVTPIGSSTSGPSYSVTWNGQPADGTHRVLARVRDVAGNQLDSAIQTVTVDNSDPTGSLTAPSDGADVSGSVTVSSNSADAGGSGVDSVLFERRAAGGGSWSAIGTDSDGAPYSVSWDTTSVAEGDWELRAVTTDEAGNSFTSAVRTVTVDNTDPTGSLSAPADGAAVRGTISVSSNSADTGGTGVDNVLFERRPSGGGSWTAIGTDSDGAPYSVSWATGSDGDYDLRAVTTDEAGNSFTASARTVTVDNTDPTGSLTAPADGSFVSGTVSVSSNSADTGGTGVDSVLFQRRSAGGGSWSAIGTDSNGAPYSVDWVTDALADGDFELRAVTTDVAGNAAVSAIRTVSVDNNAPTVTLAHPGANLRDSVSLSAATSADTTSVIFERRPAGGGSWSAIGSDPSAPFGLSWDTSAVSDGLYDLRAVATDGAGNSTASTPVTDRRVDNTDPTGSLTAPADGAIVRGTVTVSSSSADAGSGIDTVVFERRTVGGGSWSTIGTDSDGAPYAVSWVTGADGDFELRAVTTDAAGNSFTSALRTVTVDNTDPTGSLTAPADGAAVRGTITVSSNSADTGGSGVDTVLFERRPAGGGSWTAIGTDSDGAPYSVSWVTGADGDYDLRAVTTDEAGNTSTSSVRTVTVDNTDPTSSLTDPGANLRGSVSLSASATDPGGSGVASVAFQRFDGSSWQTIGTDSNGAPFSVSWDTTGASDGLYDLRVLATDNAGNTKLSTVVANRRVDNTNPGAVLTDPGANLRGSVSLSASASDPGGSGVASVAFQRFDGSVWQTIATDSDGSPWTISWNTASVSDGLHDLRALVTDAAGNSAVSAPVLNRRVDNTDPSGSLTAPADGAAIRGTVSVSTSSADAGSGVATVVFERRTVGGGSWSTIGTDSDGAPYSVSWVTGADGDLELRAVTTDAAGNSFTSALRTVTVDNTDPTGSLTAPADGAAVRGTITVSSNSADTGGSGVDTVLFERRPAGGGSWTAIGTDSDGAPYSVSWVTGADGDYDLRAVTTDEAGNTNTSSVRTVTVDNTDPTGSLTAPTDGASVSGSITVSSSSADAGGSGVDSVLFERRPAGGGSWSAIGTDSNGAPYAVSWLTSAQADGNWELRAVTTDAAGNAFTSSLVTVTVDNNPPTVSLADPGANLRGSVSLSASTSADTTTVVFERRSSGGGSWSAIGSDSSAPFSLSWDTSAVSDGLYDLRAIASDSAGNSTASTPVAARRVDNTDPSISLSAPADGALLRGSVNVTASASDAGSGIATVLFERRPAGGGSYVAIGTDSDGAPFSVAWATGAAADGDWEIRATASDAAGNAVSSTTRTVETDNTDPTGSLTGPADGAAIRGTVSVSTNSADAGSGIATVLFERRAAGGGSWSSIGTDSNGAPYDVSWVTGADGGYDLRAVTTDAAGNSFTSALRTVTVDNTDPTGSLTAPADGAAVRGTITVSSSSADAGGSGVQSVLFERRAAGGGSWTAIGTDSDGAPWNAGWNTAAGGEGDFDLRAVTTDRAGNTSTSSVRTVTVDNTDPTGSLTAPADGSFVSGSVSVSSDSADAGGSGVQSVLFERRTGGGSWSAIGTDSAAPYTVLWATGAQADGVWELRVTTVDAAGNAVVSSFRSVTVDNDPPTISLADPGANLRGSVSLSASASADTSGVVFERRPAGGGSWSAVGSDSSAPFGLSWDTSAVADGLYDLRAVATDAAGNSTASATLAGRRVDNTNPAGSLTTPADGAAVRGSVTVSTDSTDAGGSGVTSVLFERRLASGGSWTAIGTDSGGAPWSVSWATGSVTEGDWQLRAVTTDAAGNSFASALRTVTVDSTNPTGSLTAPADGAAVRGTISVATDSADVGGSGVDSVLFERRPSGGGSWSAIGTDSDGAPFSVSWATAAQADGDWDVRAATTDEAGNTTTSAIRTVSVDNTDPAASLADPGANLRGSVALSASATDAGGTGVATVSFQRFDGSSWQTIGTDSDGAPWSLLWDTSFVSDGLYDLRAVATDLAGNQKISSVVAGRRVDNTDPMSALTAPDAGASLRGTVAVVAASSDSGSGIDSVLFERRPAGGGSWVAIGTDADGAPYDDAWDTSASADGSWELRATAVDHAGNVRTSAIRTVVTDNTAPAITLTDPGALLRGGITLAANASADAGSVTFERRPAGGGAWVAIGTDASPPYSLAWDTTTTPDAAYDLRAVTSDAAGNAGSSAVVADRRVDNTAPSGGLTVPADGAAVRGTVTVTASSADAGSGVDSVLFERKPAGGAWTPIGTDSDGAPWNASWATGAGAEGDYELRATTTDRAGNTFTSSAHTVTVDNTDPSGSLTAPADGDEVGGIVALAATAADSGTGVVSVDFFVRPAGTGSFASIGIDASAPYDAAWNTNGVAEGAAELKIRATDRAGNTVESAIRTVSVDNNPPSVTLDALPANVRGTVALAATASADTIRVVFERRTAGSSAWTAIATDTSAPFGIDLDTTALADGEHELRALAYDPSGDMGGSTVRTTRLDNTAPTGSISTPAAGTTVGGAPVDVVATVGDGTGSGVVSVAFAYRRAGDPSFTALSTDTSASGGWTASWAVAALPSGTYELRAVVTDAVGNELTTPSTSVDVDSTPPTVSLDAPAAVLSGIATLRATAGADAVRTTFAYRPSGATAWVTIAVDSAAPWSAQFDTEAIADGLYDLRATAVDAFGNAASDVRAGVRIDNTRLQLVSSTPADGETLAAAGSIELVADEPIVGVRNARLDGTPAPPALPSGERITYPTGLLAPGPHTLAGELEDASGERTPFRVHFTIWNGPSEDFPYVEKNTSAARPTTIQAATPAFSATMPTGAWSAPGGDWIVLRIDPSRRPAAANGFEPTREEIELSAHWALSGSVVAQFAQPLDLLVGPDTAHAVPAVKDGSSWRALREVAAGASLPAGADDAFYRNSTGLHVLTRRLSTFTVLRDVEAPSTPDTLSGAVSGSTLSLEWSEATDNSGAVSGFVLYAAGKPIATVGERAATVAGFKTTDSSAFTVAAKDAAGNLGAPTYALRGIPAVKNLTLDAASAALAGRNLETGKVSRVHSSEIRSGRVIRSTITGVAKEGTEVPLVVSKGPKSKGGQTTFELTVTDAEVTHGPNHDLITVKVELSAPATTTAELQDANGRTVFTWEGDLDSGRTTLEMEAESGSLKEGEYTVVITATNENGDSSTDNVVITVPAQDDSGEGNEDPDPLSGPNGGGSSGSPSPTPPPSYTPDAPVSGGDGNAGPNAPADPPAAENAPSPSAESTPEAAPAAREAVPEPAGGSSRQLAGLLVLAAALGLAIMAAIVKGLPLLHEARRRRP